ncbi:MAG: PAS domain-containing protein, partial [Pseudomonadota bacterium]
MKSGDGFFENIVNNLSAVVTVTDDKGFVTSANRAMEEVWGYKREEEIGKHTSKYFAGGMEEFEMITRML